MKRYEIVYEASPIREVAKSKYYKTESIQQALNFFLEETPEALEVFSIVLVEL